MEIRQLIYSSQPFGFDQMMLNGLLTTSRRNNKRDDITGALVCRRDIYLQMLEGPDAQLQALYERISRDDRHMNLNLIVSEMVTDRLFGDWDMLHDPEHSWFWPSEDVVGGKIMTATHDEIMSVFTRLAQDQSPNNTA